MRSEPESRAGEPLPWFVRHAKPILFSVVALAAVGTLLAFRIPVAVFPSTDFPRVVVRVDNGVMPIDQMMVIITRPIEEALVGVRDIRQVRSLTSRGSAEVDLYFDWHADMFQTLQRVNAALARVRPSLPSMAEIEAQRLTFAAFPILGYSFTSDTLSPTQLWELATYEVRPRLSRVAGVARITVQGGREPEFLIRPDPAKLLATQTTVPDLLDALAASNRMESPGLIEQNHQLQLAVVTAQAKTPEELGQLVIKETPRGVPVRIADVAVVAPGTRPVYTIVTADGRPAVLVSINRQPTSNTVAVADGVHAEMERIRRSLPAGVHVETFYDQSEVVRDSIRSVRDAILIGLFLASAVLILFLADWGSSIVAGLVIPVTVLVTFIVLKALGENFDLMTLGGLAAAVGLVIDDAIVVIENIVLHRDAGQDRVTAIRSALKEITAPLVGSTITPIVVFLPLISMTGVTGVFFRALAITMSVALLSSLALALTWTPALSYRLVRRGEEAGHAAELGSGPESRQAKAPDNGFFARVVDVYEAALRWTLRHRIRLGLLALGLVLVAWVSYRSLGTDLLPYMDEGGFILDYLTPPGSSLQETDRIIRHVEQILRTIPEVENTSRRTGMELGLAAVTEANRGDITVRLKRDRDRGIEEIIAETRRKVHNAEPELDVEFKQMLQDMIGDLTSAPEPVEVKLFSEDEGALRRYAPLVADRIGRIPGVVDVLDGIHNTVSGSAIEFHVVPVAAAQAGFTPQMVMTAAAAVVQGTTAPTPVVANGRAYTVRVRFPEANRRDLDAIRNTLLTSAEGSPATLGSLASVTQQPGQLEIRRENLQRDTAVTARLEGTDLGTAIAHVKQAVAGVGLPPGVRVEYGGTYQEQQKSFHALLVVLLLAVVLVFATLLFEFQEWSAPVAILSAALLSTSGVFLALLATRTTFNIASFMGMIMVVGIVAKNGILLLDADHHFRALGLSAAEALIQAGRRRLRPIVMTAVAAVAGMLPLALAIGAGSQMLQPLAIAVIGGILISMVLSLFITPAVYISLSRHSSEVPL